MNFDKSKISFRRASVKDIDALTDNRIIFLKEVQHKPSPELEMHVRKSLKKYYSRSLKNGSFISIIAEYHGEPVAFGGLVKREQPGNFDIPNGRTGYILNMFTIKEYRRNGIGSLLFQKLIEVAKHQKLDRIDLHAARDGESMYRQSGFKEPNDIVLEKLLR